MPALCLLNQHNCLFFNFKFSGEGWYRKYREGRTNALPLPTCWASGQSYSCSPSRPGHRTCQHWGKSGLEGQHQGPPHARPLHLLLEVSPPMLCGISKQLVVSFHVGLRQIRSPKLVTRTHEYVVWPWHTSYMIRPLTLLTSLQRSQQLLRVMIKMWDTAIDTECKFSGSWNRSIRWDKKTVLNPG